jgi:hypothetical protein
MSSDRREFIRRGLSYSGAALAYYSFANKIYGQRHHATITPPLTEASIKREKLEAIALKICERAWSTAHWDMDRHHWENTPFFKGTLLLAARREARQTGSGRELIERVATTIGTADLPITNGDMGAFDQAVAEMIPLLSINDPRRVAYLAMRGPRDYVERIIAGEADARLWEDDAYMSGPALAMRGSTKRGLPPDARARDLYWLWLEILIRDHRVSATDPRPIDPVYRGNLLWDPRSGLFFHSPGEINSDNFWLRGQGWVLQTLVEGEEDLDEPYGGKEFDSRTIIGPTELRSITDHMSETLFSKMLQDGSGWPSDLSVGSNCFESETSGTALIGSALARRINYGRLDTAKYAPKLIGALEFLLKSRVGPDGVVLNIQPPGIGPSCDVISSDDPVINVNYGPGSVMMFIMEALKFPDDIIAQFPDEALSPHLALSAPVPPALSIPLLSSRRHSALPLNLVALRHDDLTVIDRMFTEYAHVDFFPIWQHMRENPGDGGNPNFVVILLSRGAGYLLKYENEGKVEYLNNAIDCFRNAEDLYVSWRERWLSPAPAAFLALHALRLQWEPGLSVEQKKQADTIWQKAMGILEIEANYGLSLNPPIQPWDSSSNGDTKADDDSWLAWLFAAASVLLPHAPNAALWDKKARQCAYDSISRPSDPPDSEGIKTATVKDDFTMMNHGEESPYYSQAIPLLLQGGILSYVMAGRPVPEEFSHNTAGLFAKIQTYITTDSSGKIHWIPQNLLDQCEPEDFPESAASGLKYERAVVAQKAASDHLWIKRSVIEGAPSGSTEWHQVVQAYKVGWYFILSYEFHWPVPFQLASAH